ncbi:hypothetical protein Lepto7376_2867 [[Leptolyngbya] sp. PCC 7376]|uniref:hypothetical protein n=1 Tax=[Leptolyngbya] sp. PCC 7376 TaxID=111781 RepID=UPI00029F3343|nr:hypothetical protein [[Leptolyngbya] sp. PCC 7376]AFY39119.1 hypothetical protein Lepto7376_2867 [[Leptolyngbya] sp. PCC 7376]
MNLWNYFLQRITKDKEQGFTIPLILGLGLFMLAIGITSIKMSSTSEINSKVQEKSLQAVAAAEVGLVRYQELLNADRTLATYQDCITGRDANGACTDTTQPSWAQATNIVSPAQSATSCAGGGSGVGTTLSTRTSTVQWEDADSADPSKGQYRLISYVYSPAVGVSSYDTPGVGTLVVEGRTSQGTSGVTDRDGTINTGTARLQVEIPILTNNANSNFSLPGLWMKLSTQANLETHNVNGSILLENATCTGGDTIPSNLSQAANIAQEAGSFTGEITSSPELIPDVPDLPPANSYTELSSGSDLFTTLPRTGVTPPDVKYNGAYHYLVPDMFMSGGDSINVTPGEKVVIYVQGNIELRGGINDGTGSTVDQVQIYGNVYDAADPTTTKYGCDGTVGLDCPTQTLKVRGTAGFTAFIHAPDAWACINGGGGNPAITGAVWIKQWVGTTTDVGIPAALASNLNPCSGNNNKTVITTEYPADLSSLLGAPAQIQIEEPQLSPTTSWERIERDTN